MKFIKKNIKIFIAFIIVIILTSSVSIYAATKYNSSEVLYEVANGNNITVETALNDLYTKNTQTLQNLLTRIAALENNSSSGSGTTDFNSIYPVGSIYISASSTNPGTLFGGTWVKYAKGRTLIGDGTDDIISNAPAFTAGTKSGNYTHSHTLENGYALIRLGPIQISSGYKMAFWYKHKSTSSWTAKAIASHATESGSGTDVHAEENSENIGVGLGGSTDSSTSLQPYIVTYMWERTA